MSQVDFEVVMKAAAGKLGQCMNASGLVYEEENWMNNSQHEKSMLPDYLNKFIED